MAQSTEKNYAGTPDDQDRRASRRDRDEAKRMVDGMDEKKKSSTFAALDSIKKRYFNRLLGDKGIKVKSPKVSSVEETSLGKITTIPKIVQRNMNEIEIQPILKNFSYVRILYDTMANEYFYEAIEPKLIEEESEILDVLKEILVENLEMLDDADRARKENYLRRIVDGLLRELGVELHPAIPGEPLHPARPRPIQDDVARDDGLPVARDRKRAVDADLRRYRLRKDDDPERDPPVHPAPDEDRVHRGHAGTELAPRELGPAPHPRRVRRSRRGHRETRGRNRHVRRAHGGPPPAPAVHKDRRGPWTPGVRRVQ